MKKQYQAVVALTLLSLSTQAMAVWDMTTEDIVGTVDAYAIACKGTLTPKDIASRLQAFEHRLPDDEKGNLPLIRSSDRYKKVFQEGVEYFSSLSSEKQITACKSSW